MPPLLRLRFTAPIIALMCSYGIYLRGCDQSTAPSNPEWTLYLKPVVARQISQSWGEPKQGRTVTGEKVQIGGVPYDNVFGVHAYSEVIFDLNKRFSKFSTKVGLPDYLNKIEQPARPHGSVIFEIRGDGRSLWRSYVVRPGAPPLYAEVSVSGINELTLVVANAEDGNSHDHACWIEPTLDSHSLDAAPNALQSARPLFLAPDGEPWSDEEIMRLQGLTGRSVDPHKVRDSLRPASWDFAIPADVPFKWKTCAVVGSSQNLLSGEFGRTIDAHEAVFRINNAPTKSYETLVGSKTTVRIFHQQGYPSIPKEIGEHRVLIFVSWADLLKINGVISKRDDRRDILVLSPHLILDVQDTWVQIEKGWPTTGLLALRLALSSCESVSVFGFGLDSKGLYGHYYNPTAESPKKLPHDLPKEHLILERLEREGRIVRFPKPVTPQ